MTSDFDSKKERRYQAASIGVVLVATAAAIAFYVVVAMLLSSCGVFVDDPCRSPNTTQCR